MDKILQKVPDEQFEDPVNEDASIKPVLRGIWQGGISQGSASPETVYGGVHSILHWVDKNNPRGEYPEHPENDSQYVNWEYAVRKWAESNGFGPDRNFTVNH